MSLAKKAPAPANQAISIDPGSALGNMVRLWDRFWFTPADPTPLCFIRACTGLLAFYVLLSYSWDLLSYVGPEAWVDKELADYVQREMPVYSLPWNWSDGLSQIAQGNFYWSIYYHVTHPGWIVGIHIFFLINTLLFTLGLATRITGLFSWLAVMSYVQRASNTVFGVDTMMIIVLTYLNIGPCGATFSLDRWLAKRRAMRAGQPIPEVGPSLAANFAIRMIQVHFCVIYFSTGTSKLLGSTWWAGTSLNLVLLNPAFAPMDNPLYYGMMRFLASHRVLWEIAMTIGIAYTLILEIGFPFLVWDRRWRWLMISGSVMLHFGIGISMGLVTFSLMMMIMVSSFIPAEVTRSILDRLDVWWSSFRNGKEFAPGDKMEKMALTP